MPENSMPSLTLKSFYSASPQSLKGCGLLDSHLAGLFAVSFQESATTCAVSSAPLHNAPYRIHDPPNIVEVSLQFGQNARLPFIVAVERGSGNQRENIFGYATAKDYTGSETSGRYTAELESFVIPEQQRKGIGNCLMDKLLQVCDGNASSPKAGATPVSVTPISKAQAGKFANARMTGAALGGAFKCSVLEGQHHYQGLATQTSWTSTSQKFATHRPKMIEYGVAIMYIRAAKLSLSTSRFNRMIYMNGGGQYGNIIVPSDYTFFKYHWPVTLADVEEPIENPLKFSLESFRNCFVEDE
ncbi:hypothetical protein ASPTUDRAFT_70809 [Aspergillus tubingensis CBS 134.48]|uniref:N-acetyltransferase domain-containing protein n=1 Tax=Aspergillus tubingensis (strain CBS 134.48) TaxID=767770 RepID=A0A1L9NIR8_ASPTC|nr:hypothetical protein ASPTUDRAFT_70809 [Aspergillus tubingensis CBS 134.48]